MLLKASGICVNYLKYTLKKSLNRIQPESCLNQSKHNLDFWGKNKIRTRFKKNINIMYMYLLSTFEYS